jgi:hypothetical protein
VGITASIRTFANSKVGYPITLVLLGAFCGATLGELGLFGAIFVIAFGFGLPIYFRWNGSLRKFLTAALVIFLLGPVFTGMVVTTNDLSPTGSVSSADPVIPAATVSPFHATAAATDFQFIATINGSAEIARGNYLRAVSVWVTNCEGDSDVNGSRGKCWLSPADVWRNDTLWVNTWQANQTFVLTINITDLPTGQIYYYVFLTAVSPITETSIVYWTSDHPSAGECTGPVGSGACGWVEGPITAAWGGVYVLVAASDYLAMAFTVAILAAIILLYIYLKGRERQRRARAKAAAGGETTPPAVEIRCPNCNAVVEGGETTCWKCKKPLPPPSSAPPSTGSSPLASNTPAAGGSSSAAAPLKGGKDD